MRIKMHRRVLTITLLPLFVAGVALIAEAQTSGQPQQLPDSPGAAGTQRAGVVEPFTEQMASSSQPSGQESDSSAIRNPVGTAAAEKPMMTGVAASYTSGAAIAPAKQRRVRTIFIAVGAIVGAGIAVGAVAALSSASPARPPGSH